MAKHYTDKQLAAMESIGQDQADKVDVCNIKEGCTPPCDNVQVLYRKED